MAVVGEDHLEVSIRGGVGAAVWGRRGWGKAVFGRWVSGWLLEGSGSQ